MNESTLAPRQQSVWSDRALIALVTLLGAGGGWLGFMVTQLHPNLAISTTFELSRSSEKDATLIVVFFGRYGYTRTGLAPDVSQEHMLWVHVPPSAAGIIGGSVGLFLGQSVMRWWRRPRPLPNAS